MSGKMSGRIRSKARGKIAEYPTYKKYKDIGIEWMGEVPEYWNLCQTKFLYAIQLGKMLQPAPSNPNDSEVKYLRAANVQWHNIDINDLKEMWASPEEVEQYGVNAGDLLVCEGGEVGRAARIRHIPNFHCIIQNSLHRVRSLKQSDNGYIEYFLSHVGATGWFSVLCNRATIAHFTAEKFGELMCLSPSLPEQKAIAAFLDRETEQIDALIAEKKNLLKLLDEKRAALISAAVAGRIDVGDYLYTQLPKKDSGIPALGEIPEHWDVERAKWCFNLRDERSETGEEELLTVSHLTGVTYRKEKDVNMFMAESLEGYKRCYQGDLVINTMWAWMGALGVSNLNGLVSPSYHVYTPTREFDSRFLDCLMRTSEYVTEITRWSKGVWSSRLRIYPESFFDILMIAPPIEEQQAIIKHLDNEVVQAQELEIELRHSIDLIKERRSALISAVVTGKIKVTDEVTA